MMCWFRILLKKKWDWIEREKTRKEREKEFPNRNLNTTFSF
jgi:hypothetical protein